MRDGMQTLLDLLRGELDRRSIAAGEWMTVLDLAQEENILPWTARCVRAQSGQIAPEVDARILAIERDAKVSAFLWSETLRTTLAEFDRRGVPVISLKGPWLARRLYGDAALRLYSDLDLLVKSADVARAEQALTAFGFLRAGYREDYATPWRRGAVLIELHDDVENPLAVDFGTDTAWDRAQSAKFDGVPARLFAPADELRFLCLHGTRHRFERMGHMLDLALAFRQLAPEASADLSQHAALDRMLALGRMMATKLDHRLAPDEVSDAPAEQRHLQQIADLLWQERMRGPAPALDWRAKHRFLLSLETGRWRVLRARMRHMRILSTRLIDKDFAFAARCGLDRRWQARMLRPVRLALGAVQNFRRRPARPAPVRYSASRATPQRGFATGGTNGTDG